MVLYSSWVWNKSLQNLFHYRVIKNSISLTDAFDLIQAPQLPTEWLWWKEHQCTVLSGWHRVAADFLLKVNGTTASLYYRCSCRSNCWIQLAKMFSEVVHSSTNLIEFCKLCFCGADKFSLNCNNSYSSNGSFWNQHTCLHDNVTSDSFVTAIIPQEHLTSNSLFFWKVYFKSHLLLLIICSFDFSLPSSPPSPPARKLTRNPNRLQETVT